MFISRVSPNALIKSRLEAEYYDPVKINNLKWITLWQSKSKTLGDLCTFITDGTHQKPNYVLEGEVFLSGKNIMNGWIDPSITKYITPEDLSLLKKNKCSPIIGDILLSKNGRIGTASVYQKHHPTCGLFVSVALLRHNSENDPQYISVVINSALGFDQFIRSSKTGVITNLHLEEIRETSIPLPDQLVQTYIGNKARQAELLRKWRKSIELAANRVFTTKTDEFGYVEYKSEKMGWATLDSRLDPVYYDKQYSFFDDDFFIKNSKPLTNYIYEGSYGALPASNSYGTGSCRFVTAADILVSNYNSQKFKNVPIEEVNKKAKISKGQILLEIKGGINYCVVASEVLDGTYVNGSVFRFTVKDINVDYLAYYLNSKFKNLYCDRVSVNNIIKYLDQESIHALPVLRLGDDIENKLAHSYRTVQILTREVFNLTQSSKFLIESLIEGQLTETQLIEAQQALEEGDNSKDRAILSKLTNQGYLAENGTALFDDLDKLYELLDQAKSAIDDDSSESEVELI